MATYIVTRVRKEFSADGTHRHIEGVFTDADHFAELNRVYERYFEAPRPVRTTVIADLVVPGMLVEITVVARPD